MVFGGKVNLRGESEVVLDTKGRMAIPAAYRELLHEVSEAQMVVAKHPQDACLVLYPLSSWEKIETKIMALPSFDESTRILKRNFIGKSENVAMDKNGRILLPSKFRTLMDFEKKVHLVGVGGNFEIWRDDLWKAQSTDFFGQDLDEMPDHIKGLVL